MDFTLSNRDFFFFFLVRFTNHATKQHCFCACIFRTCMREKRKQTTCLTNINDDDPCSDARPRGGRATFATFARFFRPLQSVALFSARQMTSEEFQDSYDKQYDAIKVKRCELDNDIPWDQLQFSVSR